MPLPVVTGKIDPLSNTIVPVNTGTWASSTGTWAAFTSWVGQPADPMIWLSELVDLGSTIDFTLRITSVYTGAISYDVYVSSTGQFGGEETVTTIIEGDEDIAAFRGRYVLVAAKVARGSGLNTLSSLEIIAARNRFDLIFTDVNSTELSGDIYGRVIDLGRRVSKILMMSLSTREDPAGDSYFADNYILADYVGSYTENYIDLGYVQEGYFQSLYGGAVNGYVVSKNRAAPTVSFRDLNGIHVDTEFDVMVTVLPEQYMQNGQVLVR